MTSSGGGDEPLVLPVPPARPRRLVYLGTPEMAVPPLQALHAAGFDIALVVTGPDKRRSRRGAPTPNPVKMAALSLGLPVSHDLEDLPAADADLGVVVAFGQLLRRPVLAALPLVNLHFSLLPRWRGAAPVERAILAGDEVTGVCVMAVEEGLDTGGVYARSELRIREGSTAADLGRQLTEVGSRLLVETLQSGLGQPDPQVGEPTYAAKLGSADRELHWAQPAEELHRVVRVGGAWTTVGGKRLKVLDAAVDAPSGLSPDEAPPDGATPGSLFADAVRTGDGWLRLLEVQPEGKGPTPFAAWANGARLAADEVLGSREVES